MVHNQLVEVKGGLLEHIEKNRPPGLQPSDVVGHAGDHRPDAMQGLDANQKLIQINDLTSLNDEQKLKKILPHTDWEKVDEATFITGVMKMHLVGSPVDVSIPGAFAWAVHVENEVLGVGFRPILGGEMPNILYVYTPGGIKAFKLDTFDENPATLKWFWDRDLFKPSLTPGMRDPTWFGEIIEGELRTRELHKIPSGTTIVDITAGPQQMVTIDANTK